MLSKLGLKNSFKEGKVPLEIPEIKLAGARVTEESTVWCSPRAGDRSEPLSMSNSGLKKIKKSQSSNSYTETWSQTIKIEAISYSQAG